MNVRSAQQSSKTVIIGVLCQRGIIFFKKNADQKSNLHWQMRVHVFSDQKVSDRAATVSERRASVRSSDSVLWIICYSNYVKNNTSRYSGSRLKYESSEPSGECKSRGKSHSLPDVVNSIDGVRPKTGLDLARYLNVIMVAQPRSIYASGGNTWSPIEGKRGSIYTLKKRRHRRRQKWMIPASRFSSGSPWTSTKVWGVVLIR